MSDTDDDRTMFVRPAGQLQSDPLTDVDVDDADKTVMMKPSQRSREAAAALSVQREKLLEDTQPKLGTARSPTEVDFDVTANGQTKAVPAKGARVNYPWIAGFVGTLLVAAIMLWLWVALV